MKKRPRSIEPAAMFYALLVKLYPKEHRRAFGAQMLQTFRDQYRVAAMDDGLVFAFWFGAIFDAARSIAHEHVAALSPKRVLRLLMLLGGVEFALIAPFRLKHIPVLMLAALAILPILALLSAGLLAVLLVKIWVKKWQIVAVIFLVGSAFGGFFIHGAVRAAETNSWCTTPHQAHSQSPGVLISANDYFTKGDYDYDRGACAQAIADYTKAISIDPTFAAAYNNRAYTYMMEQEYAPALADLYRAIELRPDYAHALMNRGDIYNYALIDRPRAIADYDRLIALGPAATRDTQVCGHRFLAVHNGWHLSTILDFPHAGC